MGLGIWILIDKDLKDLTATESFAILQYLGYAAVVVGGAIMIIGFFGCCGAIRESQCLLVMVSKILFSAIELSSLPLC